MSMIKRGTTQSEIVVSETVLVCNACGHTLCSSHDSFDKVAGDEKVCPECGKDMVFVSASAATEEPEELDEDVDETETSEDA